MPGFVLQKSLLLAHLFREQRVFFQSTDECNLNNRPEDSVVLNSIDF
jgi:hypothetical protein